MVPPTEPVEIETRPGANTGERIIILKARSLGLSTYCAGVVQQAAHQRPPMAGITRSAAPEPARQDETGRKAQQRRYREHLDRKLNHGRRWPRP
jgi:hypothetical protein